MSQQNLMPPDQAYDILVAQIHAPVFFKKLASVWGIRPASPAQAQTLLQLAGQLRNVHEAENVKAAASGDDLISQAARDLQPVLQRYGYPTQQEFGYKSAAHKMVRESPLVKEAALSFASHLAGQQAA